MPAHLMNYGNHSVAFFKSGFLIMLSIILGGCAEALYSRTPIGSFEGKLTVEWIAPNQFIYRPDPTRPLVYTAADGLKIEPRFMYTDGGSIPRLFWSAPGLGPWDFGPGYIIHDWLFEQHHCRTGDWTAISFSRSASLLAEALKTQMIRSGRPEPELLYAIHGAVSLPVAERLWNDGSCSAPPEFAAPPAPGAPKPKPITILTIEAN